MCTSHNLEVLVFNHLNLAALALVFQRHNSVLLDLVAHLEVIKVHLAFKALNLPVLAVLAVSKPKNLGRLVVG